ncbi:unnamed protein product [Litomosoides sigmodontis]|uniref:Uncharacterized protein n=1 Tax=Litomosoides sigmodontis TaxID=42156 RepID=A0A3P6SY42_LITSI|nr:unnamed protein product [Litomosoides sigmodontis]
MSETEAENDEESERFEKQINWDSLLNAADDPDFTEFLQSPVDDAINILKSGREIQKLSVIRTLSDLLESDGDQVVEKVMPLVQQMLEEECSNLDIQCEAAVAYKNIYRNSKITARVLGIGDVILNGILQNAEQQNDNCKFYLTAAAWLETLVEVIDQAPVWQLKQLVGVVPLTISQAETSQRVQRRVLATKLVNKLCANLEPADIRRDIIPCVQVLCNDPNSNVRSSMAQHLAVVAESLKNRNDCGSALVPCLAQLCKDTDIGTREAALNIVASCIPFLSKEQRKGSIVPLLRHSIGQALSAQDETLNVIAKNLGEWIDLLQDVLTARDHNWFLNIYVQIANPSACSSSNDDNHVLSNIQTSVRRMCAYNFPVVKLLPNEPALLPPFFELIRGSPAEVVGHLMGNLDQILPKISRLQLDHIIMGCNRLIRKTSSWRTQHSYLKNIVVLRYLIPVKELFISFIPMLKQEVLTTRAIPCRIAASVTLLLFMRENPCEDERQSVINFFIHCNSISQINAKLDFFASNRDFRRFFHAHFLASILAMTNDKVPSIRLQLCHMLPKIKANLYLPEDEEILQRIEGIIRELLTKEQNLSTRQLIQTYACELSRTETRNKSDKWDESKEKAEDEIWSEREAVVQGEEKKASEEHHNEEKFSGNNVDRLDRSRWRMHVQRPKTAIVRPQPQVTVTQRSPSPMPRSLKSTVEDRKSRLPLATSQNIRFSEAKHRAATAPTGTTAKSTLPPAIRRSSTELTAKSRLSTSRRNSPTSAAKPPTGSSADKTNLSSLKARRSSATSTAMSRSVSSLNGKSGLTQKSQSTDSVMSFGQGLIKVRSFSNIARTPSHLTIKVESIN